MRILIENMSVIQYASVDIWAIGRQSLANGRYGPGRGFDRISPGMVVFSNPEAEEVVEIMPLLNELW